MSPTPTTTPPVQHAGNGRFLPGNAGGPGNPYARQVALLRRAAAHVVTEADAEEVMRVFLAQAKGGDLAAAKFVFAYALGKPAPAPHPDRLVNEKVTPRMTARPRWPGRHTTGLSADRNLRERRPQMGLTRLDRGPPSANGVRRPASVRPADAHGPNGGDRQQTAPSGRLLFVPKDGPFLV